MARNISLARGRKFINSLRRNSAFMAAVAAVCTGCLALPGHAAPVTLTWNPAGTTAWATAGNWVGGVAPASDQYTNIALFDSGAYTSGSPTIAGNNYGIAGLQFGDGTTGTGTISILGTGTLTLGTYGVNVMANAGATTVSALVTLAGAQTWTNNSSNSLTFTSLIHADSNNSGLTLAGSGAGSILIQGGLTTSYGLLNITNSGGGVTISGATTFTIGGGLTVASGAAAVTISSTTTATTGGFAGVPPQIWTNNSGNTLNFSGLVNLATNNVGVILAGTGDGATTFTGGLTVGTGVLGITKSGANGVTISGATTFTVGTGGIAVATGASAVSVSSATTLNGGAQTWDNASANAVSFSGLVNSLTGNISLTLSGTGAGGFAFSGGVTTGSQALRIINSGGGVTLSTGTVSLGGGGLMVGTGASTVTFSSPVTLSAAQSWNNNSSNTLTISNNITGSNANLALGGLGNITASGVIATGTGTLSMNGLGTLTLNGSAANTYTGATAVNAGTLTVNLANLAANLIASTSTLTLGGGTLNIIAQSNTPSSQQFGNVTLTGNAGGSTIQLNNVGTSATSLTLGSITTNAGGTLNIIPASVGTSTVTTTTNKSADGTYGSRIVFNGTTASADWATTASSGSPYTLSAYGNYTSFVGASGSSTTDYSLTDGNSLSATESFNSLKISTTQLNQSLALGNFNLTLTNGGLLFTGSNAYSITTTGGTLLAGTEYVIQDYSTGTLTINAVLASGQQLTKAGPGTLILGGVNTYTGATNLNGGVLQVSADSGLGAVGSGSQVNINGATLQAGASFTLDNGGANKRAIKLGYAGGTIDTQGNTLTVSGVISSNATNYGNLTKIGSGTLILTGAATYSGGFTYLQNGTIQCGVAAALPSNTTVVMGSSGNSSTLSLNGLALTVGGLQVASGAAASSQIINDIGAAATLTFAGTNSTNSPASSFAGLIQNGTNALALAVTAGTLTLSGNSNYSGGTALSGGTLNINAAGDSTHSPIGTGTLTITNNPTIDNTSGSAIVLGTSNPITWTGTPFFFGTVNSTANDNLTFPGLVSVTGDRQVNFMGSGTTLTFGNLVSSANFNLRAVGAGNTLVLDAFNMNSGGGGTTIVSGTANFNLAGTVSGVGQILQITTTGTVTLGSANNYTGATQLNTTGGGGNVILGNPLALGSATTAIIYFGTNSTNTLSLNGNSITVVQLISNSTGSPGTETIQNASATAATLTINDTGGRSYYGAFQDGSGGGTLSVTKNNTNTLTFGGSATLSGNFTIADGQVAVTPQASFNGPNLVMGGGTNQTAGTKPQINFSGRNSNVTFASTTFNTGLNEFFVQNFTGNNPTIQLGTITHAPGAAVMFATSLNNGAGMPTNGNIATTTANTDFSGTGGVTLHTLQGPAGSN